MPPMRGFAAMGRERRGEQPGRGGRVYDLERMRVEGHEQAVHAKLSRAGDQLPENVLVSAMDTIEASDGDGGSSDVGRQSGGAHLIRHR